MSREAPPTSHMTRSRQIRKISEINVYTQPSVMSLCTGVQCDITAINTWTVYLPSRVSVGCMRLMIKSSAMC